MQRQVVAIDGPAGSGKSTAARLLAGRLGWRYLDSGALYRCVALLARRRGVAAGDSAALAELTRAADIRLDGARAWLDGEDVSEAIRTPEISRLVSRVAMVPEVREGMVRIQRAAYPGEDMVVEGRDIGSVVFPDAARKFYLTASPEERARRRARDTGRDPEEELRDLGERDARDSERAHSPLVRAEGALEVDTTGLGIGEVVERLARLVTEA